MAVLRTFCALVLLLVSIAYSQSPPPDLLPDLPIDEWLRGPDRSDFPWRVHIRDPWLTFQQRHTVQLHADFRIRDLRKRGLSPDDLHFILKVAPAGGDWLPEFAHTHAEFKPEYGDEVESVATFYARPGKYKLALIAYDTKNHRGNVWHSDLNVPGVKDDPLPDADRNLPLIQFLPQVTTARTPRHVGRRIVFDDAAFGAGMLSLPVANELPIQLDVLANLSLSDATNLRDRQAPDWLYQVNADTLLQVSNVVSQLDLKNGCVRLSAVDILRQEVFLDRADASTMDWEKLIQHIKELQRIKIEARVLAKQKQTADVFATFVEGLLDGPGCQLADPPIHVLAVVGDAFIFPNDTDRRILRARHDGYAFYFKLMPIGAGNWDQIEGILKPLHPTHYDFSNSLRFRKALASFMEKLHDISRRGASQPTASH